MGDKPGGVLRQLRTDMRRGRFAVTTAGADGNLQLVGADPWGSPTFTGLQVPATPTPAASPQLRYLFMLCRASFQSGERVRLVGYKQYAELLALLSVDGGGIVPQTLQITSPLWRFPDANISWHVYRVPPTFRDTRNPANADSLMYQDAGGSALLYAALGPYVPPNGGRPYGSPIACNDLGNLHDLRYPWRDSQSEVELNVPIATPCDVVCFASVAQHDTSIVGPSLSDAQAAAACPEDRFYNAFGELCQYGRIAASMIFEEEQSP